MDGPVASPEPLHFNRRLKAIVQYADRLIDEWRPIEPLQTNWFVDLLWFRRRRLFSADQFCQDGFQILESLRCIDFIKARMVVCHFAVCIQHDPEW